MVSRFSRPSPPIPTRLLGTTKTNNNNMTGRNNVLVVVSRAILLHAMVLLFALPTQSRAFAGGGVGGGGGGSRAFAVVGGRPRAGDGRDAAGGGGATGSGRSSSTLARLRAGGMGGDVAPPPPAPPTNFDFAKFYFPCLALWISGPLLSLVDTSFVGLSARAGTVGSMSSASQLAALGPATTFIDGSLYLFAFLNVATTNLYASALASRNRASDGGGEGGGSSSVVRKNGMGNDELPGEGVVRTAAKTSLYSGIGLMLLLLAVARPLIALYIGEWCSKRLFRRREVVPIRSWMLWDEAMMLCGNDFVLCI